MSRGTNISTLLISLGPIIATAKPVPSLCYQLKCLKFGLNPVNPPPPPGVGGGNSWWGFSSYSDQKNVIFHTRLQTRPLKSIPVFRPGL